LCSGVAEAIKHGAIADEDYFSWLVQNRQQVLDRALPTLVELVARSVEIKAEVVAQDEREAGLRATLNFGHTIGHALESDSGFQLTHGEAVAIGMVAEAELGAALGITEPETASHLREAVRAFGLPHVLPHNANPKSILETIGRDKKSRVGAVRFALLECIGRVAKDQDGNWTHAVGRSAIRENLEPSR
jgi:3-dehydroquinate synthase